MDRNTIADAVERWEPDMKPRRSQGRPLHATDFSGSLREYQPTLRERVGDALARWTGHDTREGAQAAQKLLIDPATSLYQVGRRGGEAVLGEGGAAEAAIEGLSSIPGAGKALGMAASPLLKGIAGPLAKSMFLGVGAKLADKAALREAQKMLEMGNSAEEIFKKTGWFKGLDDKWRFEIEDPGGSFLGYGPPPGGKRPIEDVFDRRDLYENYPRIGRVKVEVAQTNPGLSGGYSEFTGKDLDPEGAAGEMFLNVRGMADPETTMTHELQHAVQGEEGFAMGGGPPDIIKEGDPGWRYVLERREQAKKMASDPRHPFAKLSPEEIEVEVQRRAAQDIYERIQGEAEARNTANRIGLTMGERRRNFPLLTMDVPPNETIIERYGQGNQPVVDPNQPRLPGLSVDLGHFAGVPKEQMEAAVHDHIQRLQRLLDRDPDPMKRQEIMRKIAQLEALSGRK